MEKRARIRIQDLGTNALCDLGEDEVRKITGGMDLGRIDVLPNRFSVERGGIQGLYLEAGANIKS